ncbi:hypothetical protein [Corynebacterium heidelbergense]|uniref:Uncharacterized protein n=1 Tax=Corynebacterium heidelbergense TaxID=2055947 RepID=A0A364V3C7_9CORY|nr:hypothetical protein [Corynebacterium heidelbergense]RAV31127.1 hypothetical protein DLJ54_10020 [Corynebacterium heidelbergense]
MAKKHLSIGPEPGAASLSCPELPVERLFALEPGQWGGYEYQAREERRDVGNVTLTQYGMGCSGLVLYTEESISQPLVDFLQKTATHYETAVFVSRYGRYLAVRAVADLASNPQAAIYRLRRPSGRLTNAQFISQQFADFLVANYDTSGICIVPKDPGEVVDG